MSEEVKPKKRILILEKEEGIVDVIYEHLETLAIPENLEVDAGYYLKDYILEGGGNPNGFDAYFFHFGLVGDKATEEIMQKNPQAIVRISVGVGTLGIPKKFHSFLYNYGDIEETVREVLSRLEVLAK